MYGGIFKNRDIILKNINYEYKFFCINLGVVIKYILYIDILNMKWNRIGKKLFLYKIKLVYE